MKCHTAPHIWIIAEQENGKLKPVSCELLARARTLADDSEGIVTAVLFTGEKNETELMHLIASGADRVIAVVSPQLDRYLPEPYAKTLVWLIEKYSPDILLGAATSTGRTLLPSVAVTCHTGLTADCTGLEIEKETGLLIQTRPAIGGNILATIKTPHHKPQMATVRPHSARPLVPDTSRTGAVIFETIPDTCLESRVRFVSFTPHEENQINVQDAEIVVAGGRGCKKQEHFTLIKKLADILGGAVGASRDAVDLGWVSYPHQIGLSGKTVCPKLYIGAGISGAIQHLAGMKTADHIIAVNNDPDAQIFKVADMGITGSLHEVLPLLADALERKIKERASHEPSL